jgi:hypothetical protein
MVFGTGAILGAVYISVLSIVPTVAFPPGTPATDQIRLQLDEYRTVAENWSVALVVALGRECNNRGLQSGAVRRTSPQPVDMTAIANSTQNRVFLHLGWNSSQLNSPWDSKWAELHIDLRTSTGLCAWARTPPGSSTRGLRNKPRKLGTFRRTKDYRTNTENPWPS